MTKRRVTCEVVAGGNGRLAPFAVYFPSGHRPTDDESFEVHQHVSKRHHYVVAGEREGVALVGETSGAGEGPASQFAVGLLDRASGKLRVCLPEGLGFARMEVRVEGVDYVAGGRADGRADELTREERVARNKALVAEFGSLRRRRQMNLKEGAVVHEGAIAGSCALTQILTEAGEKAAGEGLTKEKVLAAAHGHRNLPPHDPTARWPWQAYPWEELCPAGPAQSLRTDELLRSAASPSAMEELQGGSDFNGYVRSRAVVLRGIRDKDARRRAANWLAFVHPLMVYWRAPGVVPYPEDGLGELAAKWNCPEGVVDWMLSTFASRQPSEREPGKESFVRSKDKKDLLTCFVFVAALGAEEWAMEDTVFDELRFALKADAKNLAKVARELGCDVKSSQAKAKDGSAMYKVGLLSARGGESDRRLEDCFPKPKLQRASRR